MYAFLNPKSGYVDVYTERDYAYLQAVLAGQRFVCCFDEDEPYIMELAMKEEDDYET